MTTWKKVKTKEAQHGGKRCTGDEEVKKECNVDPCPGNSLTNKMPFLKLIFFADHVTVYSMISICQF